MDNISGDYWEDKYYEIRNEDKSLPPPIPGFAVNWIDENVIAPLQQQLVQKDKEIEKWKNADDKKQRDFEILQQEFESAVAECTDLNIKLTVADDKIGKAIQECNEQIDRYYKYIKEDNGYNYAIIALKDLKQYLQSLKSESDIGEKHIENFIRDYLPDDEWVKKLENMPTVDEFDKKIKKADNSDYYISNSYQDRLSKAIDILIEELSKDKSEGSYYYGWQANIAMCIADEKKRYEQNKWIEFIPKSSFALYDFYNDVAKRFLELLIFQKDKLTETELQQYYISNSPQDRLIQKLKDDNRELTFKLAEALQENEKMKV